MRTVVVGERPPELAEWIERRRRLGQDLFDEVWDGEYHLVPGPSAKHGRVYDELMALLRPLARRAGLVSTGPFNLGGPDDFRVPDGGLHRGDPTEIFLPTAAVVVEVLSPHDETYEKLPFYAKRGVAEVIVADPEARAVGIWRVAESAFTETDRSQLLGVTAMDLKEGLQWP